MKVLFLTPWYPNRLNPNHGVFVRDQVQALSVDHDLLVIAARIDYSRKGFSQVETDFQQEGRVTLHQLWVSQSWPVFNQLNFFFRIVVFTWRKAREFQPDLIHGNIGYPGGVWAWLISLLIRRPYVVTEHTRIGNNFRSGVHTFLTKLGFRKAAGIILVSQRMVDEVVHEIPGAKPVIIPNVINFDRFPYVQRESPNPGPIQLGFLGGLDTPVKGLDLLIDACSNLKIPFVLHVGGTGKLLAEYQQQIQRQGLNERCAFYGAIPHAEVPHFLQRIQVFVSASRYETFGVAMVEALATGIPVIATASGGPEGFITPENGILVPVEDPQTLTQAITRLYYKYNEYSGRTIAANIREQFSASTFRRHMQQLYDRVAKLE